MPYLRLTLSEPLENSKRDLLLKALSKLVAEGLGKPEHYVMVSIDDAAMIMSGEIGSAAFADIKSIGGLSGKVNKALCGKLCGLLQEMLGIPSDKIYANFTDIAGQNWGLNGTTFG
ncbi:MAG: phenylpyruvate tautomerase MIF-related protein [Chitinivibrionales bacterium]|nr:phenylpyruvate tautomerase MIF-related protein [Chitinivibrionales bacterium]